MAPQLKGNIHYHVTEASDAEFKTAYIVMCLPDYTAEDILVKPVGTELRVMDSNGKLLDTVDLHESVDPFSVHAQMVDNELRIQVPLQC